MVGAGGFAFRSSFCCSDRTSLPSVSIYFSSVLYISLDSSWGWGLILRLISHRTHPDPLLLSREGWDKERVLCVLAKKKKSLPALCLSMVEYFATIAGCLAITAAPCTLVCSFLLMIMLCLKPFCTQLPCIWQVLQHCQPAWAVG